MFRMKCSNLTPLFADASVSDALVVHVWRQWRGPGGRRGASRLRVPGGSGSWRRRHPRRGGVSFATVAPSTSVALRRLDARWPAAMDVTQLSWAPRRLRWTAGQRGLRQCKYPNNFPRRILLRLFWFRNLLTIKWNNFVILFMVIPLS